MSAYKDWSYPTAAMVLHYGTLWLVFLCHTLAVWSMSDFFFSNAFVTCVRYHGNRNGHSTSLGKRQKEDDGVIKNENQALQ